MSIGRYSYRPYDNSHLFPPPLLSQTDDGPNSRDRLFSIRRTFWRFLSQVLTPNTPCRSVVRQAQAFLGLHSNKQIDSASSAYVTARRQLPVERLTAALLHTAAVADRRVAGSQRLLAGRPIKVVDATSAQLPDTPDNQQRYPQPKPQKPGCGFPVIKLLALFSLASGALLHVVTDNLLWNDLSLFRRLWDFLRPKDILLGDRAFSDYGTLATLPLRGVDVLCRLHQGRRPDFRRLFKRLGKSDGLIQWTKPVQKSSSLTQKQWKGLPRKSPCGSCVGTSPGVVSGDESSGW